MLIRYFISLVFTVIVLVITCLLSNFYSFLWLINIPSALIAIIFPLVFLLILHGWKDIVLAFCILCKKDIGKKDLLNAKIFFKNYTIILFSIGFIGFIISFLAMMRYLEVAEDLGPRMAIASMTLLYAGIINLGIIMPYNIIINNK